MTGSSPQNIPHREERDHETRKDGDTGGLVERRQGAGACGALPF